MNNLFISSIILFCFTELLFPQDSVLTKPIHTKNFDLTYEYYEKILRTTGVIEKEYKEYDLSDCKMINSLNDSTFSVSHLYGNNILLFNNIKEVSFKGKSNKLWEGVGYGTLGGFTSGLLLGIIIYKQQNHNGFFDFSPILIYFFTSVCTIVGSVTGGIIGALTKEKETFDFSKYNPDKRKEKFINLMLKYKINL